MPTNTALVLGASSGIGRATCEELATHGYNVVGVHFDAAEGQEQAAKFVSELQARDASIQFFNANAVSAETRAELCSSLQQHRSRVKVLVHSLAFGTLLPLVSREGDGIREQQLNMTMQVMAHSLLWWTRDLLRQGLFDDNAKIFAMTSAGSSFAAANYGAVSAAKAALESHVRQLAVELAPHGIAANALRAGVTLTPAFLKIPGSGEIAARAIARNPHARLTQASEVAQAIRILSEYPSSWITGNVINVDGGEFVCG
jgi:NAD(P)-dependent dehydrogenase (short-subunit alcohol dehydrogenase family)